MGRGEQKGRVVRPPSLIGGTMKAWKRVIYVEDVLWRQRRKNDSNWSGRVPLMQDSLVQKVPLHLEQG